MPMTCAASVLVLLASGCGGTERRVSDATEARTRVRVAVLPSQWATETPMPGTDPSASLAAGLQAEGTMEAAHGPPVEAALQGRDGDCAEDPECVRAVGEQLSVHRLAALRLAGLGNTVMVRVRLVEVASGAAETARQSVIQNATAARVDSALRAIGRELAPAPERQVAEPRRWYESWWLWTLVGVAAVGGAVAVVIATRPESQGPEFVITPP